MEGLRPRDHIPADQIEAWPARNAGAPSFVVQLSQVPSIDSDAARELSGTVTPQPKRTVAALFRPGATAASKKNFSGEDAVARTEQSERSDMSVSDRSRRLSRLYGAVRGVTERQDSARQKHLPPTFRRRRQRLFRRYQRFLDRLAVRCDGSRPKSTR